MQDRKLAFVNAAVDSRTVGPGRVQDKASPYIVQAGTVIAAALITGIRSDLPGQITAQMTEDVHDSPTGSHLLIPQGSRLMGQYDSQAAFGQRRVLLVWNRIVMPDGTSIVLERLQGTDTRGFAGLEDEVDYHWGQLFRAAALSTLLGVGTEIGAGSNENEIAKAIRESAQDTASDIGQQIVRTVADVFADPQIRARGMEIAPQGVPGVRTPISLSDARLSLERRSPLLGEHTAEILTELDAAERDEPAS